MRAFGSVCLCQIKLREGKWPVDFRHYMFNAFSIDVDFISSNLRLCQSTDSELACAEIGSICLFLFGWPIKNPIKLVLITQFQTGATVFVNWVMISVKMHLKLKKHSLKRWPLGNTKSVFFELAHRVHGISICQLKHMFENVRPMGIWRNTYCQLHLRGSDRKCILLLQINTNSNIFQIVWMQLCCSYMKLIWNFMCLRSYPMWMVWINFTCFLLKHSDVWQKYSKFLHWNCVDRVIKFKKWHTKAKKHSKRLLEFVNKLACVCTLFSWFISADSNWEIYGGLSGEG